MNPSPETTELLDIQVQRYKRSYRPVAYYLNILAFRGVVAGYCSLPGSYQKPAGCRTCQWPKGRGTRCGCAEVRTMVAEMLKVPGKSK